MPLVPMITGLLIHTTKCSPAPQGHGFHEFTGGGRGYPSHPWMELSTIPRPDLSRGPCITRAKDRTKTEPHCETGPIECVGKQQTTMLGNANHPAP